MLTPFGVVVTEATGGAEAVRLAEQEPFDLLLMDIRMPGIDGPSAAKALREGGGANGAAPIVAFTAEDAESLASHPWAALFDGHVAKPVVAANLLTTLMTWAPMALAPVAQSESQSAAQSAAQSNG
jgi:CheY-like chemotaxis protein